MARSDTSDEFYSSDSDSEGPGIPAKVRSQLSEFSQAASLPYSELLTYIQELNDKALQFNNSSGRRLHFYIKKRTDRTFLWRFTVRIRCITVNSISGVIEKSRLLGLRQFLHVHKEILRQSSVATQPVVGENDMNTSMLSSITANNTLDIECCICMDHQAEIVLACSHVFCESCINQWCDSHETHHTCPICRKEVRLKNDTWVLAERPDPEEVASEATGYVMGLVDRCGVAEAEDAVY